MVKHGMKTKYLIIMRKQPIEAKNDNGLNEECQKENEVWNIYFQTS